MQTVYKVVKVVDDKYVSLIYDRYGKGGVSVQYELNKKTVARVGSLFAFREKINAFDFLSKNLYSLKTHAVLECETRCKIVPAVTRCELRFDARCSSTEYLVRKFWSYYKRPELKTESVKGANSVFQQVVPDGTVFVKNLTPVKVIFGNYLNNPF